MLAVFLEQPTFTSWKNLCSVFTMEKTSLRLNEARDIKFLVEVIAFPNFFVYTESEADASSREACCSPDRELLQEIQRGGH